MDVKILFLIYIFGSLLLGVHSHFYDREWRRKFDISISKAYLYSYALMLIPLTLALLIYFLLF